MKERFIEKFLDKAEMDLLERYDRWLKMNVSHIPLGASETEIHQYHLIQPASLSTILYQHVTKMFNAGMSHGDIDAKSIVEKEKIKLSELPFLEGMGEVTPEEALSVLRKRQIVLAGQVENDLVSKIKDILIQFIGGGLSPKEAKASVSQLLDHNKNRASLIVATETTYAYNRGRLVSYHENKVDYVRFSAIMDGRTSTICRSRDGKVMAMNDPDLEANTPPLHGRCRSVLTPIYSRYEPQLITESNTDWSKVEPLPKGWRTA